MKLTDQEHQLLNKILSSNLVGMNDFMQRVAHEKKTNLILDDKAKAVIKEIEQDYNSLKSIIKKLNTKKVKKKTNA